MRRPGLRAAMLVPLLATLVVGSVALGVYVDRAVERDLVESVDEELTRAIAARVAGNRPPGGAGGEGGDLGDADANAPGRPATPDGEQPGDAQAPVEDLVAPVQVNLGPDGTVISSTADDATTEQLAAITPEDGVVTIDGDPRYRAVAVSGPQDGAVVVGLTLDSVDDSLASLRRNLVVGGIVLVTVQGLIVLLVARYVSRPVRRISVVAHEIREGDLDAEVPEPAGPEETAALTDDLAAMLDRLRATIAERERAAADADRARADMERFMADASHELRTPLTALRGYGELYRSGMLDDEGVERAMARIGDESERLGALVTDLLQLARPDDPAAHGPVDLGAIASAVVHDLRAAAPSHVVELDLGSCRDGGAAVVGDAARLHQAVLNLAANACHHTPAGTNVTVRVGHDGDDVVVAVADDGPGVDVSTAADLFQPFTRSDASRSRRDHDGAGLGLALVERIATDHGGSVAVSATPGGGATFTLRLPAGSEAPVPNL